MDVFATTFRTHAHRARKQGRCHQRACKRSSHMHMGDTLRRVQVFGPHQGAVIKETI